MIHVLMLNDMRSSNIEILQPVARAKTPQQLLDFMQGERVAAYQDLDGNRPYQKGGPLEWFNTPFNNEHALREHIMSCGEREDWIKQAGTDWDNKVGVLPEIFG